MDDFELQRGALPKPAPGSPRVTAVMRGNRRSDTGPEKRLRSALHARGLRFRKDQVVRLDRAKARPDIVFGRARLAVFVDGCFWHGCPEHHVPSRSNQDYWLQKIERNKERDRLQAAALESAGWLVLRVWEHEPIEHAADRVVAALRRC